MRKCGQSYDSSALHALPLRIDEQNFLKWYKFEVDLERRGSVDLCCVIICVSFDL